jgi:hypothetical protein
MFEQKKLGNKLHLETNEQYKISTKNNEKQLEATFYISRKSLQTCPAHL